MKTSRPLMVNVPAGGVRFAESVHEADFRMTARQDPFHKVIYVLAGRVRWSGGPERLAEAEAGDVLVLPAGESHRLEDRETATLLLLGLASDLVAADVELGRVWAHLGRPGRGLIPLDVPARRGLEAWWRRALLEQAHERRGQGVLLRSLAAQVLVTLARRPPRAKGGAAADRVETVGRHLEETFYEEWTLDRAAKRAGLSRRRFSELFRAATGQTFTQRLTELRLTHAARLLRSGEHTVVGVIFSCGFGDVSNFYRLFRARHGVTPKAWMEGKAR
jgi:AraC family L-rhamnose operon regulatory protein RhaS